MNHIFNLIGSLFVVSVLWSGGAMADAVKPEPAPSRQLTGVFSPDPEGVWRAITKTDGAGGCIGDPVAPLCAIDTRLACFVRRDEELCKIAEGEFWYGKIGFRRKGANAFYIKYRVETVRRAGPVDLEPNPKIDHSRKLGDLLVELFAQSCWESETPGEPPNCLKPASVPTTYTLRQTDGRWSVVSVHSPPY